MDTNDKSEDKDGEKKAKKMEEGDEEKKNSVDTETPTPIDTTKNDLPELNVIEKKYKELLVLQDAILGNINALEDSLGSAEKIVQSMTKTVSPFKMP
jgi:PHD/YefM family antitoxin component YafN of YafNO toxin-antitoxin module